MKIIFSRAECKYIVTNSETDLVLTGVGMNLIDAFEKSSDEVQVDASKNDYEEFLDSLRDDYIRKIQRLPDPTHLTGLARRLLPDFRSLTPMNFGDD